ncbi:hypothetical protein N7539_008846 [Penicillium diatomitis]|uniref:Uncharacterized protein n=1 Tax=Penicillium diatomitis TaxID=2819901 RepID=A0A9W9WKM9_9EURO|nr:uncharacterized protein N7539_008846 [Penicillium diatomitis]KAJ5469228.1 hypothetical protein N7539_008846 [Penicillium diatomitis]
MLPNYSVAQLSSRPSRYYHGHRTDIWFPARLKAEAGAEAEDDVDSESSRSRRDDFDAGFSLLHVRFAPALSLGHGGWSPQTLAPRAVLRVMPPSNSRGAPRPQYSGWFLRPCAGNTLVAIGVARRTLQSHGKIDYQLPPKAPKRSHTVDDVDTIYTNLEKKRILLNVRRLQAAYGKTKLIGPTHWIYKVDKAAGTLTGREPDAASMELKSDLTVLIKECRSLCNCVKSRKALVHEGPIVDIHTT